MTVAVESPRSVYSFEVGTPMPITFSYGERGHISVMVVNPSGRETPLQPGTDFQFIEPGDPNQLPTDIRIIIPDFTEEYDVVIFRRTPVKQGTEWLANTSISPEILEADFDNAIRIIQEVSSVQGNTLRFPLNYEGEPVAFNPNMLNDVLTAVEQTEGYKLQAALSAASASADALRAEEAVAGTVGAEERAAGHADRAGLAETNAAEAATSIIGDVARARDWAIKMDGLVEGEDYSSKYHAGLASTSESSALLAAQNAASSAQAANTAAEEATEIAIGNIPTAGPLAKGLIPLGGLPKQVYQVTDDGARYEFKDLSSIAAPIATPTSPGIVQPDGETITVNGSGVISASITATPIATPTSPGISQPDNVTITVANGVFSAAVSPSDIATLSQGIDTKLGTKLDITTYNANGRYGITEIDTGKTWTDGRTIYRKFFTFGTNTPGKTLAHGINSIDLRTVIISGTSYRTDLSRSYPLPTTGGSEYSLVTISDTNIVCSTSSGYSGIFYLYVILEYCKTT
jgi:hypothetical protein